MPCSPLPKQASGLPGVISAPVISITFLEISLLIHSHYQHIKSAHQKERTEKMLPPQLLSHELLTNNGMRKERKHFLPKKYFPVIGHKYSIRVTSIFYHIFACLSIKLENLSKYYCFGVFNHADSCQKKRTENVSKFSVLFLSEGNIFY